LSKAIKLSGNEVEQYWPTLFAKALKNANISDLLSNVASAGPAAGAAGPAVGGGPAAVEEKKEEKKEEVEEVDMGNLFGGDDEY
jgi:ribosomal protein L12E/L44/L45/RPP1/RPP2